MIAAPHGRSGKTVLTLGLLRALSRRGLEVQPFKKGADFIDPGWHTAAAGRTSRNLDRYFMDPGQIRAVVREAAAGADVCVVEAAMGLYDGLDAEGSTSSAEIAKITATPVVLVLDVTRMTRTAGALVLGCCAFDPEVQIAGVILNKVRGARQRALITEVIEGACGVPVVGSVPKDACMDVPDRHLGLVTSAESGGCEQLLDGIAAHVERHVDVDALLAIARGARELPGAADARAAAGGAAGARVADAADPEVAAGDDAPDAGETMGACARADGSEVGSGAVASGEPLATIGVMRDEVFSFYYPENLIALERAGARLVDVRSLEDAELPAGLDGLYLGGGFPEEFAARLEANESLRASVRERIGQGLPVFAECGGLLYLGRSLTHRGETHAMAGALGFDAVMHDKQQAHGYAVAIATGEGWLPAGTKLVGHEHHHSQVVNLDPALPFALENERGRGVAEGRDGVARDNVIAGYLHVNALASPAWAPAFVQAAARYRVKRLAR